MLEETELDGIYRIKDSRGKITTFSNSIKNVAEPKVSKHFLLLFKKIDELTGATIDYVI